MSICLQLFVHNATNNLFASVPAARSNPDDYEVSVCNANGVDLLLALGLALESMSEPYTIDAFAVLATTASAEPHRMTMIFLGRHKGYVEERLGDLAKLIQRGRAAGTTHFSWE